MAEIDFSNATIEVVGTNNPIQRPYVVLDYCNLYQNFSTNLILSEDFTRTVINWYPKYQAVFSGTIKSDVGIHDGFYMLESDSGILYGYKISNINFNPGDTFHFIVSAEIQT